MVVRRYHKFGASCLAFVVLAGALGVAPFKLHAEDNQWTTGVTIAKGHFNPEDLCKNAGHGCRVVGDSVNLRIDHAAGRVEGVALAKIAYRPYPNCAEWELISYMEFSGDYQPPTNKTHVYMAGRIDVMASLDFEMWDSRSSTCKKGHRDIPDTGAWEGGHNVSRDQYVIELAFQSDPIKNSAVIWLDGTWSEDISGFDLPPICTPGDTDCANRMIKELLGL